MVGVFMAVNNSGQSVLSNPSRALGPFYIGTFSI